MLTRSITKLLIYVVLGTFNSFFGEQGLVKRETRFTSKHPASEIISKIEETAMPLGFDVKKNNYKVQYINLLLVSFLKII